MNVSLPMYDWPETQKHNDELWRRLQPKLLQLTATIPTELNRTDVNRQWQADDLLLSQTCAYPLITSLPESTVVVGTPNYGCDFFDNGHYSSPILVRQSDHRHTLHAFSAATLAFNSHDSQSGFNALKSLLIEEQLIDEHQPIFFSKALRTGSHRASIKAVAQGQADLCAVDPVSWALAQRFDADTQQLRVLTNTAYTPALPLISSANAVPMQLSEQAWRVAIMHAFDYAINAKAEQHLLLNGITFIPKGRYLDLPVSNLNMITQT